TLTQRWQGFGIFLEHVLGRTEPTECKGWIEWVETHMRLSGSHCAREFSRPNKSPSKSPIREIRIECNGSLEFPDCHLIFALLMKTTSPSGVTLRKSGAELAGSNGQFVRTLESDRIHKIAIHRMNISQQVRMGKLSVGAGVIRVDQKRALQKTPCFVELFHF